MKSPVVVVGMGELGSFFSQGLLKSGHPVFPILRGMALAETASELPHPERVLLAVGEAELPALLATMPVAWRGRLALLQNELLPQDWLRHDINDPTLLVVWLDKKKDRPCKSPLPSMVCGPKADLFMPVFELAGAPCRQVPQEQLLYELAKKILYILVINLAGIALPPGTTVEQLWNSHRILALAVANEILDVLTWRAQQALPRESLVAGMVEGFDGDPQHVCRGRTALERLERVLSQARKAGIGVPTLVKIAEQAAGNGVPAALR